MEAFPADLLERAASRARTVDQRALRFRCHEVARRAKYVRGEALREKSTARQYLLVREAGGVHYGALRRKSRGSGRWKEDRRFPFPEPLAWTQIFDETARERFRFGIGPAFTTPWRLARPVRFGASGLVRDGRRIDEWSGTAWIEVNSGNVVRIEARPNFQDRRLEAEFQKWITSFSFIGLRPFAKTPIGHEIRIDFDEEHEGFLYPSRVELRTIRQVAADRAVTISRTIVEYRNYEFFRSETDEEIGRRR
jgi:hypothetical protein